MVGYEDYADFPECLKKYTGIPPVEYARKGEKVMSIYKSEAGQKKIAGMI